MTQFRPLYSALVFTVAIGVIGCATGNSEGAKALRDSSRPAWSLKSSQDEMIVAASPMRRTLQVAGSTGFLVGAGVDLVINGEYRDEVRTALNGYDANAVFRAHLEKRLKEALTSSEQAPPMQSAAGYANEVEARQARYSALAKQGFDTLLDLRMRYGLYGTNVDLVADLDADVVALPSGKHLASTTVFASPEPALASDRPGNPQKKKRSSESAPRFSVDKEAFARLTANNGELLRTQFEKAVEGVTDALLADLGLTDSARGEMYLGKMALSAKEYVEANEHLEKALRIDPTLIEARNTQSVVYAQGGHLDTAVQLAQGLTKSNPEFAPAWYNLAWWHALDLKDPATARPYYEEAVRLGMARDAKLEEALAEK